MIIRKFVASDITEIVELFYDTVHTINRAHYSQEQLDVWAPREEQHSRSDTWLTSLLENMTYVAEIDGCIAGFSDMSGDGHLDRLFIHKDFQRRGIASELVDTLEAEARARGLIKMDTDASITAKPFFENRGFQVVRSQEVLRKGISLANYKMEKILR